MEGAGEFAEAGVVERAELFDVDLDGDERHLLRIGLNQWGGPAHATEEMAYAMGFDNVKDLSVQARRIMSHIEYRLPMSHFDWTRALLATEIVFSSAVVGAAGDWTIVTAMSDEETIDLLRRVQRKLARAGNGGVIQRRFGTRGERRRPVFWQEPPVDRATAAELAGVSVGRLDEWWDAGLLRMRPMRTPNPQLWWLANVLDADLTRRLLALEVPLDDIRRTLLRLRHTSLIVIEDGSCFAIDPGRDLLPARPMLVLDVAAVADALRQRWPVGSGVGQTLRSAPSVGSGDGKVLTRGRRDEPAGDEVGPQPPDGQ